MKYVTRAHLPPSTPEWILEIIEKSPHGGWFVPFQITPGHPLLEEGFVTCFACGREFHEGEYAFVQPFFDGETKRWVATHRLCMAKQLGVDHLIDKTPLARFYMGHGTDGKGRTLEVVLAFSDEDMEEVHDYIQWLFPLPEPSKAQPRTPVMTEADLELFRTDEAIRANVLRSFNRWVDFMEGTTHWLRPRDHNHLRITRIIRFLTLIGMGEEAELIYHDACGMMLEVGILSDQTRWFWSEARKPNPGWLR